MGASHTAAESRTQILDDHRRVIKRGRNGLPDEEDGKDEEDEIWNWGLWRRANPLKILETEKTILFILSIKSIMLPNSQSSAEFSP